MQSYAAKPTMPVINGEVHLRGVSGRIPAEIPRLMFWTCMSSGRAGHTYGANGIWQLNRRDPALWQVTPWGHVWTDSLGRRNALAGFASNWPGQAASRRYPWQRLEPHPEWAAWAQEASQATARSDFETPYTAGIPGELRITYAPLPRAVKILGLEGGRGYTARYFDPVTGKLSEASTVHADVTGTWTATPPPGTETDWVILLER